MPINITLPTKPQKCRQA